MGRTAAIAAFYAIAASDDRGADVPRLRRAEMEARLRGRGTLA